MAYDAKEVLKGHNLQTLSLSAVNAAHALDGVGKMDTGYPILSTRSS